MRALGEALRGRSRRGKTKRVEGHIEQLPSGSARVRVYAGTDILSGKHLYLKELVKAGPDLENRAEAVRAKLVSEVIAGDCPRTDATVEQLMDRHLEDAKLSRKNKVTQLSYHRKHIAPILGPLKVRSDLLDAELFDAYYAELARCRDHCDGKTTVDHYTDQPHSCGQRCRPHVCRPLKPWTIRKIHFMLNVAFKRAVRWKWIPDNPMRHAEPPPPPASHPQPPTQEQAARIVTAAWHDLDYGRMVWLAITTGARLGELCALCWTDVEVHHTHPYDWTTAANIGDQSCLDSGCTWTLSISRSIEHIGIQTWVTDTKTHQHRRIALDPETVAVLLDLRQLRDTQATLTSRPLQAGDYLFHREPTPDQCLRPGAVSIHYSRFTAKLGIETTFHKLRHYSATELITAGVDIRTVAGRLGHGGGGTTTLKVYAAWVSEADQRAATVPAARIPAVASTTAISRRSARGQPKFAEVADQLRDAVHDGRFPPGTLLPTMKDLAAAHDMSVNTAHAAVNQLATWGYVTVSRGRRAIVTDIDLWPTRSVIVDEAVVTTSGHPSPRPGIEDANLSAASGDISEPTSDRLAPVIGHIGDPTSAPPSSDRGTAAPSPDDQQLVQVDVRKGGRQVKTLFVEVNPASPHDIQRLGRDIAETLDPALDGAVELHITRFGTGGHLLTYVLGRSAIGRQAGSIAT